MRDTNYPVTTIYGFINDTQNAVANEYWLRFWEADPHTYTLSTSTQDLTNGSGLPSDFIMPLNLRITTSGYAGTIDYIEYRDFEENYPTYETDPSGTPKWWYMYGDTIYVYPKPDQAYTVKMRYTRSPTQLSAGADVPEIPASFEELLIYGGSYRVFEDKDMENKATDFENKYQKEVLKLVNKYAITQTNQPYVAKQPRRRRRATSFFGS